MAIERFTEGLDDLDFAMFDRPERTGRMVRRGGWVLVRPTSKGSVVIAKTQSRVIVQYWEKKKKLGEWVESR